MKGRRPNFPKRSIPPVRRLIPRSVYISSDRQAVVLSRVLFFWTLISSPSYTDRGGSTLQLWCPTNKMSSMNRILPREGQSCQILWKISAPVSELSSLVEIYSRRVSWAAASLGSARIRIHFSCRTSGPKPKLRLPIFEPFVWLFQYFNYNDKYYIW